MERRPRQEQAPYQHLLPQPVDLLLVLRPHRPWSNDLLELALVPLKIAPAASKSDNKFSSPPPPLSQLLLHLLGAEDCQHPPGEDLTDSSPHRLHLLVDLQHSQVVPQHLLGIRLEVPHRDLAHSH
eukprot:750964-Hanusia_phi.AAC.2